MQIVIASSNLGKIREFREMFRSLSQKVDLLSLINFPDYIPLEEEGDTFEQIAENKAKHAAIALKQWVIADDSGLVVPALGGAPGIYSRRYAAATGASDGDNLNKLLAAMAEMAEEQRHAYFVCALAIASAEGYCKVFTGHCEGILLAGPRGRHGFGYDPIFVKHDYEKTFAELDEATKNRISHRRKAFEKLAIVLETVSL